MAGSDIISDVNMECMEASLLPVENQLDGSFGNAQSHTLACQYVTGRFWKAGLQVHTYTHRNVPTKDSAPTNRHLYSQCNCF